MLTLIPTEHWDYRVTDMIRGLVTGLLAPRPSTLESYIEIPGLGFCLSICSARAAIILALKALRLRPGAWVGVPLYCCPVVLEAIKAAGCRPRFVDIDSNTFCLSPDDLAVKSSEVDAVIAVHMFGNVCDISKIRDAAPNKPIIEDCAQALGSRFNGKIAGSLGDIAVFSFRSGKYLSVGEGGALYSSDSEIRSRVSALIDELPVPSRKEEVVHVLATVLRSLLRRQPLWGWFGNRVWQAHSRKISYTTQASITLAQIYNTDRSLAIKRLPQLCRFIDKQRSNADYYSRNLSIAADMLDREEQNLFSNRLQYPLVTPGSEECERLAKRLHESRISTARPYKDIVKIAARHYDYTGDCPQAERIARTVLVIPCNYALNATELQHIATCVNQVWEEINDRRTVGDVPPVSAHRSIPRRYSKRVAQ